MARFCGSGIIIRSTCDHGGVIRHCDHISVYFVGEKIFGKDVGIVASGLYAVSLWLFRTPFFMESEYCSIFAFFFFSSCGQYCQQPSEAVILDRSNSWHRITASLHIPCSFWRGCIWFLCMDKNGRMLTLRDGNSRILVGFFPFLAFEIRHGFMNIRSISYCV